MPLALMPNAEALVSAFLRDQPEVAAIVDDRVYTAIPLLEQNEPEWRFPLVRVVRYGGAPLFSYPLWADRPTLQLDAFGGPKAQAFTLAETCRAALSARVIGKHDEYGVVSDVEFGGMSYVPDDSFASARPRYLFSLTLTAHPIPA